jgi:hypothetical protein
MANSMTASPRRRAEIAVFKLTTQMDSHNSRCLVRAFDHRFRLGLSVAPPSALACLTSLADCLIYFALC